MMKTSQRKKIIQILKSKNSFYVSGHVQPDGDSIGAVLGLYHCLKKAGKKVVPLGKVSEVPPQYRFLPGIEALSSAKDITQPADVFISVDAPNVERLGEADKAFKASKIHINIDHHLDNDNFGEFNLVDLNKSSVCEIVFWLLKDAGFEIDLKTATCLYTGIVTDTGRFQYTNTFPSTFEAARILLEIGVLPAMIFSEVYENLSFNALKLLGKVLSKAESSDGLVWSTISRKDLEETKADLSETETFIDMLRSVKGVKVAAIFKEIMVDGEKMWRVSLRGKNGYDVQKIAQKHGGGGHKQAAGYKTKMTLDQATQEIIKYIKEQNREKE